MKLGVSHRRSGNNGDELVGPDGIQNPDFTVCSQVKKNQLRYAGSSFLLGLLISFYRICIELE